VQDTVQAKLDEAIRKAKWILDSVIDVIFFDRQSDTAEETRSTEFERVAADAARSVPHVARVYTRQQLMANRAMGDLIGQRVMRSFHPYVAAI